MIGGLEGGGRGGLIVIVLCSLLSLSSSTYDYPYLTKTDVHNIRVVIRALIDEKIEDGVKVLIPGIVRLIFHDCIHKCDGCINPNLETNARLLRIVDWLEEKRHLWPGSRADYWAIAGEEAILKGRLINNERCDQKYSDKKSEEYIGCYTKPIKFKKTRLGRKDCNVTSPYYDQMTDLPNATMNHQQMFDWFGKHFRKGPAQIVSMMGAHTLGRVNETGLNLPWEEGNEDGLGRQYFRNLLDEDQRWINVENNATGEWHWIAYNEMDPSKKGFALTCDMTQARNIIPNAIDLPNGQIGGSWADLRKTRNGWTAMVNRYVIGKTNWSKTFPRHIRDMLATGYDSRIYSP